MTSGARRRCSLIVIDDACSLRGCQLSSRTSGTNDGLSPLTIVCKQTLTTIVCRLTVRKGVLFITDDHIRKHDDEMLHARVESEERNESSAEAGYRLQVVGVNVA